ncbi:MAG: ATP synthase subunit I [Nitrospinaceae bacterium]|nr:AtpZ/AtpI family protein [Nitrospinaceae bacterium]NIR55959.1 AtpZ/AtpI family protein [Nitrospinaceae bacterium]NIS86402.1 AtpZ/AtpI family protein [Nitrospinaceae bacterium]NIT83240.1 AtpZ/AtpI family protein [Nitrospinaceae bacterium]NIU45447.1 AtpZ/AtpI family protein [Nitrospinaceae bacterium]
MNKGSGFRQGLGYAIRLGAELAVGILFGAALGYGADRWLGTSPWLLALGILLGTGAGFMNVFRAAQEMEKLFEEEEVRKDQPETKPDNDNDPKKL